MSAVCSRIGQWLLESRRAHPIAARVKELIWFCLKWAAVLGAIGGAVAIVPYYYRQMDREIRAEVQRRLAERFPHLQLTLGSVDFIEGEGISVRHLRLFDPACQPDQGELLYIDELVLHCQQDLKELIEGDLQVTKITIRRPVLRAVRRNDDSWGIEKLLRREPTDQPPVETCVESATVEIRDPLNCPPSVLVLRDFNLVVVPRAAQGAQPAAGHPSSARVYEFRGRFEADQVRNVELAGLFDGATQQLGIGGKAEAVQLCPELRAALPRVLAEQLAILPGLRAQADVQFSLEGRLGSGQPWRYAVSGQLFDGRLDDSRLPHPLTDIRAVFRADNLGVVLEELVANSNQATVRLSARLAGFGEDAPKLIEADIRQLELDRRVLAVLPESLQDQWHKYRPAGTVDVRAALEFDGHRWRPDITVRCSDLSFAHYKFPYRLEEAKGTITFRDDLLKVNLLAYSGLQPVQLEAQWHNPTESPVGWLEVRADDIQIDAKLLAALPDRSRRVVQSLNARGQMHCYVRMWRSQPEEPMHKHVLLTPNGCSVQYERFPYPIQNIRGVLEMFDDAWSFRNLEGFNGKARISGQGHLRPTLEGNELLLNLTGAEVQLDEQLRDALRPNEQQLWHMLRPRGACNLSAEVRYLAEKQKLSVAVRAETLPETTSIEPVHFPYRMEKLQALLDYRDGRLTIDRLRAEHGAVKITTSGNGEFHSDGRWRLALEALAVDRLRLDRDLIQALPDRLKRALLELNPNGPVSMSGSFQMSSGQRPGEPVQYSWDLRFGLVAASAYCGVRLDNIHGSIALSGSFDGYNFYSLGELSLDSLSYNDLQFTHVIGPIWIDDHQVLLGGWVARRLGELAADQSPRQPQKARPITARLFGGLVEGDGWVTFSPEARFGLRARLINADLAVCAREVLAGQQQLRGFVVGEVELRGNLRSTNSLSGRGHLRLGDGDVYELPLMIALLKLLAVRKPDKTTFSNANMDFRIEGEHIYFDRINFHGDMLSLLGKGEMDFQQNIRLSFHAAVGRGQLNLPLLKDLFADASRQIMLIHVTGTLQNPEMRKEAFPGVNQAIQQLQGDGAKPPGPLGLLPNPKAFR